MRVATALLLLALAGSLPAPAAPAGSWAVRDEASEAPHSARSRRAEAVAVRDTRPPDGATGSPVLVVTPDFGVVELLLPGETASTALVPSRTVELRFDRAHAQTLPARVTDGGSRLVLLSGEQAELRDRFEAFVAAAKRGNRLEIRMMDPVERRQRVVVFSLKGSSAALKSLGY